MIIKSPRPKCLLRFFEVEIISLMQNIRFLLDLIVILKHPTRRWKKLIMNTLGVCFCVTKMWNNK